MNRRIKSLAAMPLAFAMVLLTGVSMLAVTAPTAQAAVPDDYRIGYAVTVDGYTKTVGTLAPRSGSGGNRIICIDSQWGDPATLPDGSTYTNAQLAYLMKKYINTSSNVKGAAVAEIVKEALDRSQDWRKKVWAAFKSQHPTAYANVVDEMADMRAEAKKYAGAYTLSPTLTVNSNTGRGTASFGIKTGSDNYYSGVNITLTLSGTGGAKWDSNGSTSITVASTTALQSLAWTATGPGIVQVVADTPNDLPGVKYRLYNVSGNKQDMVGAVFTEYDVTGTASLTWAGAFPALSSSVGTSSYAKAGDKLTDSVTVDADTAFAGQSVKVNTTIYGPLAAQPTSTSGSAPSGTPVFQTLTQNVTLDANGNATANFTSKATTANGFYVWQESTEVSGTLQAATSTYGRAAESTSVFTPTVTTQVSDQQAKVGDRISDTATISGWAALSNPTYPITATLSGKLLGPVSANTDGDCTGLDWTGAKTAYTIPDQAVSGNKTLAGIGAFTVLRSGCYTYTYTLTGIVNGATVWTVNHAPGQVSQTALIQPRVGITSHVVSVAYLPNKALADDIQVTGIPEGTDITVHGSLYGPFASLPDAESDDVPADAPLIGTYTDTGTADEDQTVDIRLASDAVTETGYYIWVESSDEAYDAASETSIDALQGTFGRKSETSLVLNPATVTTQISQQSSNLGDTLVDTVTVTGLDELLGFAANANAEINGKLYGPVAPVNGSCTGVDWTGAKSAVAFNDIAVTKDGDLTGIGSHMVVKPGCYSYGETLSVRVGDTSLFTVAHAAGRVEQTSLAPVPTVVTNVSATSGDLGLVVNDSIVVDGFAAGGISADARVIASLRGPLAPVDGKCEMSADDWTAAMKADKNGLQFGEDQEIVITGNGTYTTDDVKLVKPGCYTWIESLRVDGSEITATEPGMPTETTLVYPPTMVTTTSNQVVGDNATIYDTIEVSHMAGLTGTIDAQLWGPYILDDESQDCSDISTEMWQARIDAGDLSSSDVETLDVAAEGTYVTTPVATIGAGCYTWTETLTVGDSASPDYVGYTPPGLVEETTLVLTPRITTVATSSSGVAGAKLTDQIDVTGLHNQAATISGEILGPVMPAQDILDNEAIKGNDKCIGLNWDTETKLQATGDTTTDWTLPEVQEKWSKVGIDWTNAPVLAKIDNIQVDASGQVVSQGIRTPNSKDGQGCYTFVETITPADTDVEAFTTDSGIREETIYLVKPSIPTGLIGDMNLAGLSAGIAMLVAAGFLVVATRRRPTSD